MKLEIGKRYITRNGECVKVIRKVANPDYPFVAQTKSGEEQWGENGNFEKYSESMMDIIREADVVLPPTAIPTPPPPPAPTARICIARYCRNDAQDGELCPSCRFAVMNGKGLPGPSDTPEKPEGTKAEQETVILSGAGWEVTLRKLPA